jgi:hypothetical protein
MRRKRAAWRMAALLAAVPVAASMAALPAGYALARAAHSGAAAASAPSSPGLAAPQAGTSSGCPAGFQTWVPRAASIASEGARALVPPGLPTLSSGAADNPALKAIIALHPHWLSAIDCESTDFTNPLPGSANQGLAPASVGSTCESTFCSANWSGYQDRRINKGYSYFNNSWMEWTVPAEKGPSDNTHAVSVWPGLGTGNNSKNVLIQAGTQSQHTYYLGVNFSTTFAWYELVPGENEKIIGNLPVHVGTKMFVSVEYEAGKTAKAVFFLCAGKTCGSATQTFKGSSGKQVEWIAERPTLTIIHTNYTSLDNFGKLTISDLTFSETNKEETTFFGASSKNATKIDMTNCAQTQWLALPGSLRKSAFTDVWKNYGKNEHC